MSINLIFFNKIKSFSLLDQGTPFSLIFLKLCVEVTFIVGSKSECQIYSLCIPYCCIFQPAYGCCALQTLVEIVIFSVFCAKNLKKQEICSKILQKTCLFEFAPKCWSTVLFPSEWFDQDHVGWIQVNLLPQS